jgi:hypothetical protein
MTDRGVPTFAEEMEALTQVFHERLRKDAIRFAEIDVALAGRNDAECRRSLIALRDLAHQLCGTAGSFGAKDVCDAADLVENTVIEIIAENCEPNEVALGSVRTALRGLLVVLPRY